MQSSIKRILKLKEQEKKILILKMGGINSKQNQLLRKINDIDDRIQNEIKIDRSDSIANFEMFLKNSYDAQKKYSAKKEQYDEEISLIKQKIKEKTFDYKRFEKLLIKTELQESKKAEVKEQQKMDFWFANKDVL